ncbi:cupin domain-containing protein [Erythrobacter sp. F6033]|uniref:cupin domain-containing protein n=1 Tax=Erythrobacter sp. F6033 TaxID=2926401 RepID=UPI001FF2253A|nr:cupin domain-containing protein [Erythrobacter sp. F6033]MCK0128833.1 cupin domain-containing protein [Erythrobacter sp. F6033]
MEINAQFDQPVLTHTDQIDWVPSPMAGVDRRMLDRIGDEVARATSIVRYAQGSSFPEHTHSGGEEFIVLEGVFQDEHGDYPAGTYVRNPVGTHHVPGSAPGCTIFVKLWQFDPADQEQMSVDLNTLETAPDPARSGVSSAVLAARDYEHVSLEVWDANAEVALSDKGGFELLILEGTITHDGQRYKRHDWIRWPANGTANFTAGAEGAKVWIKRGHLTNITAPAK